MNGAKVPSSDVERLHNMRPGTVTDCEHLSTMGSWASPRVANLVHDIGMDL